MIFLILLSGVSFLVLAFVWITSQRRKRTPLQPSDLALLNQIHSTLFNMLGEALVIADAEWKIVDCNPAFTALFGYTACELIGKPFRLLYAEGERTGPADASCRKGGSLRVISYRKKSGEVFSGETRFSGMEAHHPLSGGVIALVRDGASRAEPEAGIRQVAETLERQVIDRTAQLNATSAELQRQIKARKSIESHLAAEHAVTQILAESGALAEVAPKILQVICESLGWSLGIFWRTNDQVSVLTCIETWQAPSTSAFEFEAISRERIFWPGEGLPGRVWTSGEPAWLTEIAEVADFVRAAPAVAVGLHSALAFPIRSGSGISGVVEFLSREIKRPDAELLQMLSNIGSQIGQFIDRKEAERALLESETRKRAILDAALDCMITVDHEGKILEFNAAAERTFGYTKAALLGQNMADRIIPPHLRRRHRDAFESYLLKGEGPILNRRIETTGLRADGSEFPVELTVTRIPLEGPPVFQGFLRDITERKQMETTLQRREEHFRALIEQSSEGIVLASAPGMVRYASPSTSRLLGYAAEEFVGRNLFDLIHSEDRERTREALSSLVRQPGGRITVEYRIRHRDGAWRWMEGIGTNLLEEPSVGAVVINYRDITDRKRAEEALAAEKERLAVTLGSIGDGVIATDVKGRVIFINPTAEQLSGWCQEEAIGRPLSEIFHIVHEKSRAPCENPVDKVLATGNVVALANHTVLISKDGREHAVADSGAPIRNREGEIIGVVLVFRDVTEKQKMQEELLRASTLESVGLLAGGVAHDFNNILTAILGNLSLAMLSLDRRSEEYERLAQAEKASIRARDLAQQLLTFAKGGVPFKKTASLVDLLQESANFVVRGSNVRCEFSIQEKLWPVEIDEGQVSQVIHNLVLNAQQAMPEGGIIQIRAENKRIKEAKGLPLKEGDYVHIAIRDFGIGIPKEHLSRIFDPYFTTKQKGSGLGLPTSYSIIKKHDGYMTVDSELGKGSTFSIYLPAFPNAAIPREKEMIEIASLIGHGRVLVMDDEEIIRDVLQEMLRRLGYEVTLASEGAEAVALYRLAKEAGHPFDVVIMDLTVPGGVGGKEAIRKLREIDPEVKAIVSSGYSNDPFSGAVVKYGFNDFVAKPFRLEELGKAVKRVVSADH